MPEPIEELFVSIGADTSDLLNDTKKGVQETEQELKKFEQSGKRAFDQTASRAQKAGGVFRKLVGGIRKLATVLKIVAVATAAFVLALKLFPSIARKFSGPLKTINERASKFGRALSPLITIVGRFNKVLGLASGAATFIGILGAISAGATALVAVIAVKLTGAFVGFFTRIGKLAVDANAKFETFTTQFVTLLGSTGAAQKRLAELAKFGVETPFELPDIVEASRVLQVFGGDILATGKNLQMIGDIAAGVNLPFKDVAFWVGRMFDALQSGRPFGESAARLQEMGALSGIARAELERLQKEGASGNEIWAKFNELVGTRFAGNMERLSGTFQGITSNLIDFRDNLLRIGGEALFEEVREDAKRFLDLISDEDRAVAIENIAKALGEAAAVVTSVTVTPLLDAIEDIDPETLDDLANALNDASAALSELTGGKLALDLNGLIGTLTILIDVFTIVANKINAVELTLEPVSPIINDLKLALLDLLGPLGNLAADFFQLQNAINTITGKPLVDFTRQAAEASETDAQRIIKAREAEAERLQALATSFEDEQVAPTPPTDVVDEEAEKIKEILRNAGLEFIDLQAETNAELEENQMDHAQTMAEIEAEGAEARLEINEKFDKKLKESQADIFERAKKDLARLEDETNRDIDKRRKDADEDEFRETEDHLTDMRRLRLSFLDNLEDAVKSRDAGRVRDLQRQFARESQERQTDFDKKQGRERSDTQEEIAEVTRNEERRAREIIDKRTEALAKVESRIEESRARELASLDEKLTEEREKENIRFMERQAELENALNLRLETLAKELSDMEDLEAESAQRILETLNETFGAGGNIDQLMQDFANRRRQTLVLEVGFEQRVREGEERLRSGGAAGGFGSTPGSITGFQHGGTLLARKPTLAMFGETPELVQFTPLSKMGGGGSGSQKIEVDLKLSGSAPPGIRSGDRDAIAGVMVNALREAGVNAKPGR